jgi:hypothetical protein
LATVASTFTWLDYSEHERRKMLDVIELFGERTTRDELGIGGIRDAFADLLFPGTSTIQTRAKYFLFVPWIYLILQGKHTPAASIATKARKLETELITALMAEDESGVIGGRAKENLQRLPSSIYWQGLHDWGIRLFVGSQQEYHRSVDVFYVRRNAYRASRAEFEGESQGEAGRANWHSGVPDIPADFPRVATFSLRRAEAEYLRERILSHCDKSLLAVLVRERIDVEGIAFAWDLQEPLPPELKSQIEHGRNFSEAMLGAQLLYNLMLAERRGLAEKIEDFQSRLHLWWETIEERALARRDWDRRRFWHIVRQGNPRVPHRAKAFVTSWLDIALHASRLDQVVESQQPRDLIEQREVQLKHGLARLRNQRALELWPGAAGDRQLDFRWTSAQWISQDIVNGLENSTSA